MRRRAAQQQDRHHGGQLLLRRHLPAHADGARGLPGARVGRRGLRRGRLRAAPGLQRVLGQQRRAAAVPQGRGALPRRGAPRGAAAALGRAQRRGQARPQRLRRPLPRRGAGRRGAAAAAGDHPRRRQPGPLQRAVLLPAGGGQQPGLRRRDHSRHVRQQGRRLPAGGLAGPPGRPGPAAEADLRRAGAAHGLHQPGRARAQPVGRGQRQVAGDAVAAFDPGLDLVSRAQASYWTSWTKT